jgi:hypothetical protein
VLLVPLVLTAPLAGHGQTSTPGHQALHDQETLTDRDPLAYSRSGGRSGVCGSMLRSGLTISN